MGLHLLLETGSQSVEPWLSWLLTYLAHAVLWTGAMTFMALRSRWSFATRNLLWKMALVGPLATTLVAATLAWGFQRVHVEMTYTREVSVLQLDQAPLATGEDGTPPNTSSHGGHSRILAAGLGVAAALGALRFTLSARALRRTLRRRSIVRDERLLQRIERMRLRFGLPHIVLTESPDVGGPLVVGLSEICIPRGELTSLGDAEIDNILAHELAHIERRDGIWFPLVGFLQSLLWLEPLLHWSASRFRETAESACDDRAVELTGDPRSLAQALTHVAEGAQRGRRGDLVATMASRASTLVSRVERLTGLTGERVAPESHGRPLALAGVVAIGLLGAGLSVHASPSAYVAPDPAATSREMSALASREQRLMGELDVALEQEGAEQPETPAGVHVLELRQELSHVRATEAWVEARFVEQWTSWEQRANHTAAVSR